MATPSLPRAEAALRDELARGLCTGAQLSVWLPSRGRLDLCVGTKRAGGTKMAVDTLCQWCSTAKPVAAIAVAQCVERGLVDVAQPVATYVP